MNVNYLGLRGGYLQESLRALTGMPVLTFHTDKQEDDELEKNIKEWANSSAVMSTINT